MLNHSPEGWATFHLNGINSTPEACGFKSSKVYIQTILPYIDILSLTHVRIDKIAIIINVIIC